MVLAVPTALVGQTVPADQMGQMDRTDRTDQTDPMGQMDQKVLAEEVHTVPTGLMVQMDPTDQTVTDLTDWLGQMASEAETA